MTTFGELSLGDQFQRGDRIYIKTDDDRCRDVDRRTAHSLGEHEVIERAPHEHGWHISLYYLHLIFKD
jgi:hypothetical protein